jgi:hypothetical protein
VSETKAPRRSKYRNVPTVYAGLRYDSKLEAAQAAELDFMVKAGVVLWWIRQPTFRLGCPENIYKPDFLVQWGDGRIEAMDVKGAETPKFKRDRRLWQAYGPIPLLIVKEKKTEVVKPIGGQK